MFIDALAQIIVPRINDLDGLAVTQPLYEWEGVEYPQGPKKLDWKQISLTIDEPQEYVRRLLPSGYISDDWVWLKISDATLSDYEDSVNYEAAFVEGGLTRPSGECEMQLESFIRLILADVDSWVLSFVWHYDQIDGVHELDVEGCIKRFRGNFVRDTAKQGFIGYK